MTLNPHLLRQLSLRSSDRRQQSKILAFLLQKPRVLDPKRRFGYRPPEGLEMWLRAAVNQPVDGGEKRKTSSEKET